VRIRSCTLGDKEFGVAKKSPLAEKLSELRSRIAGACAKANRQVSEVTLIAVTKTAAPEQIREILQLGVGDLGESRVQVLTQRAAQINEFFHRQQGREDMPMPSRLRWHMVGHLQRNKVKSVLGVVDLIHSVDSLRLAEEMDAQGGKLGRKVPVLLQVNASEETSKHGVAVGAAIHLAEQIDSMPGLQLVGLMTMAPLTENQDQTRMVFSRTREIFEEMRWQKIGGAQFRHLSMGMSSDFEQAILEGATMLRIGTLLFGGRSADQEEGEEAPELSLHLRKRAAQGAPPEADVR
jgi:pyridoxal phosphate enzyme (YggS family)